LPNLIAVIAPFARLIAALHTLHRLNSDSELIVLTAAGATVANVARPLIVLALIVSAGVALVNHVGQPWSLRQLRDYVMQIRADLLTQVIQPGRFSSPEQGLTFHIRERSTNGELLGLIMHDVRKPKQSLSYLAERGMIVKQDNAAYLVMTAGHIVRQSDPADPAQIIAFDKYAIDLNEFEQKVTEQTDLKPRERYLGELLNPEATSVGFQRNPGQFGAELHERFANPFYPIAFVLIALAAAGQARSTRQGRTQSLVAGFVAAAAARLGGLAITNVVVLKPALVPLLYLIPIAAGVASIVIMIRSSRMSRPNMLADRLSEGFSALIERLPSFRGEPPAAATGGR
jgi:lipopolysaccharide export system permease protein